MKKIFSWVHNLFYESCWYQHDHDKTLIDLKFKENEKLLSEIKELHNLLVEKDAIYNQMAQEYEIKIEQIKDHVETLEDTITELKRKPKSK